MPTPRTPPPPSCCAGLRLTALHGWQQDFPLHPSPFRQMAQRSGATQHELLAQCQRLQRSGALAAIQVRWGAQLPRHRERLGFRAAQPQALIDALRRLPGCVGIDRVEVGAGRLLPGLWAELETVDAAALERQLAGLPEPPLQRLSLLRADADRGGDGPRQDRPLAAALEQGLPLQANPFVPLARRLQRSERQLLATLLHWQRAGWLAHLALATPADTGPQALAAAAWEQAVAPRRLPLGSSAEQWMPSHPGAGWPWGLWLLLPSTAALARSQLQRRVSALGIEPAWQGLLLRQRPRAQALLFADQAAG